MAVYFKPENTEVVGLRQFTKICSKMLGVEDDSYSTYVVNPETGNEAEFQFFMGEKIHQAILDHIDELYYNVDLITVYADFNIADDKLGIFESKSMYKRRTYLDLVWALDNIPAKSRKKNHKLFKEWVGNLPYFDIALKALEAGKNCPVEAPFTDDEDLPF